MASPRAPEYPESVPLLGIPVIQAIRYRAVHPVFEKGHLFKLGRASGSEFIKTEFTSERFNFRLPGRLMIKQQGRLLDIGTGGRAAGTAGVRGDQYQREQDGARNV